MLPPISLVVHVASLLCNLQAAFAIPDPFPNHGQTIPLSKRQPTARSAEDWGIWAKNEREMLQAKYGGSQPSKRSQGTNLLINSNGDSSYLGSIAIGTPPFSFYVMLDTGSSDLWVANGDCSSCSTSNTYDSSASSTFQNLSQSFSITYGSGSAAGSLVSDAVEMAGFSVTNQAFGAVTHVSQGILSDPVSGIMGLGWQPLAASSAMPFWETLVSQGAWSQPVMGMQLTRFLNDSNARQFEPGGSLTLGWINSSLYTGNIDWQNLATTPSFWVLAMSKLTVQGNSVTLGSGAEAWAAIDSGTTLIGGPAQVLDSLYSQIPGAQPGNGSWEGYYTYPCSTQVTVTMAFGGPSWTVSPADFRLTQIGSNTCVGALFVVNTQSSAPNWIVGDSFLKNVFSVFRAKPASVGFASLSSAAVAMNGVNGQWPTATIGPVATTVTATSGTPASTWSGARPKWGSRFTPFVVACATLFGITLA